MEEGYLALRWNNHNTIFTKILNLLREQEAYTDVSLACGGRLYPAHKFVLSTCSDYFKEMFTKTPCKHPIVFMKDVTGKDLESLLDFMYKGEVHVPQSELGSLLRTAEGLQVKGLAVPDDAARASNMTGTSNNLPSVPSATSFLNLAANRTPVPVTNPALPIKRKRVTDSHKKDEPPKLTPRPEIMSQSHNNTTTRTKSKSRVSAMPELKRIKLDEKLNLIRNNNTHIVDPNNGTAMETSEIIAPISPLSPPVLNDDIGSSPAIPKQEIMECKTEDEEMDGSYEGENGENENERGSVKDEYEEEEDDDDEVQRVAGERMDESSPMLPSEVDENSSLPNSEISTAELLQVDLSEDGTQFIIGPGGLGGEASRASSAAGEEEGNEDPKKPFVCLLCGHTFTRRDNLANHLKTHTGDRPFMCQYCHKCFSRKDYLKQHERIHTGEKPYACEICGRAFTRKEGLTDHMRCHSDFKAFACETCGKSFKQKCGLRFHKRNYRH